MRQTLTAERARELFDYDAETGVLLRKVRERRNKKNCDCVTLRPDGYFVTWADGTLYRTHRLAWLIVHGRWPAAQLDHINGDRADNRLQNLREASDAENLQNLHSAHKDSSTKLLGVTKNHRRWMAMISLQGSRNYLGTFDTPEEAHAAYLAAKAQLHPFSTLHKSA